ncbi:MULTISPECIES: hypothetical protein [Nocardia]|uniref:hypothetical protein n=1 Tax=Nocardia TaxID=1817 RepID=UPI0012F6B9B6|nr:hypothetical protein [Nocardia araoensis]
MAAEHLAALISGALVWPLRGDPRRGGGLGRVGRDQGGADGAADVGDGGPDRGPQPRVGHRVVVGVGADDVEPALPELEHRGGVGIGDRVRCAARSPQLRVSVGAEDRLDLERGRRLAEQSHPKPARKKYLDKTGRRPPAPSTAGRLNQLS